MGRFAGLSMRLWPCWNPWARTVVEVSIPNLELINPAGSVVQTSEAATIHRSRLLAYGDQYDPVIRRRFESGLFIPAEAYLTAQRVRARCRQSILDTLESVDLLATPTTSIAAPLIEQERVVINGQEVSTREAVLRITRIFSAAGLPAVSVPCGFTAGASAHRVAACGQAPGGRPGLAGGPRLPDGDGVAHGAA